MHFDVRGLAAVLHGDAVFGRTLSFLVTGCLAGEYASGTLGSERCYFAPRRLNQVVVHLQVYRYLGNVIGYDLRWLDTSV